MHVVNRAENTARAMPALSILVRQPFDIRFHGGNAELHSVALAQHRCEVIRSNLDWTPIDLNGVPKTPNLVPADRQYKGVALDAAAKRVSTCEIGHFGSSMNGHVHCTPSRNRWKAPWPLSDQSFSEFWLRGAVLGRGAISQHFDRNPLGLLKSGPARAEGRHVHFHGRRAMDVHGEQSPLICTPTPDVGRVGVPGSMYGQRDAMKRLRCLICCHFYRRIYSQAEFASRGLTAQGHRDEVLSVAQTTSCWGSMFLFKPSADGGASSLMRGCFARIRPGQPREDFAALQPDRAYFHVVRAVDPEEGAKPPPRNVKAHIAELDRFPIKHRAPFCKPSKACTRTVLRSCSARFFDQEILQ